ncbi:alpha/beta hydrolase [Halalkalicoccus jeotgali]|uniref:Alpha/beta hydrolase fold protein n=1 Tax=Halalkalicoccus jeotgali (strain DSM 18796 / CECT 7217 / JCM 14584 / KCTC 4019 / B3) TaxID=795797 RepID=D8J459_HALJB|nr:alpha/beta fold hydrolase [Halalkalicoccus jeotgali]ADJ15451.1 alpha/beta hydrolase fold protein [Halalkalicoccus jeotgali B3]ELY36140.1 alpha/beta hydrolase fold protein [Halalkalicoccus jeotgali B3]
MEQREAIEPEYVSFMSEGTRCAASLYRPYESSSTSAIDPPIVVMANGFGLPRNAGLPAFAEHFAGRGIAVLLFDYRSLGESDGEPRNVAVPFGQIADWQAAVRYARIIDGVDGGRLGVYGFSLGGGGALITAAREDVDAYVGRTPILDGARTIAYFVRQLGPAYGLRTTVAGLRDLGRKYTGREPYYIPIWGVYPDELPALAPPGSKEGHEALVGTAASDEEVNRCAARAFLTFGLYRPITSAHRVNCPALVIEGATDTIAPKSAIAATVARLPDMRHITIEADHFGAFDESFEEVVEREGTFLERHLLGDTQ